MKLKNNIFLNESKRHLSSNLIKILIFLNLIISIVSALTLKSSANIELFYYDVILHHFLWFGLLFLILSGIVITVKIITDTKKNYSLISRFKSKKQLIKSIFIINVITVTVFIITCYMTTFLAFNLFSNTTVAVKNLEMHEFDNIFYVGNLTYLIFFLIRTLLFVNLICLINIILLFFIKKWQVLLINIVSFYYIFWYYNINSPNYYTNNILGFLDIKRYFSYPRYLNFKFEVMLSVFMIVFLSILVSLSINLVKYVRTMDK